MNLQNKQNNILLQGLKNLRLSLGSLDIDQFVVNSLEMLMELERDEHLERLKREGCRDKGNGTYPRSFKSLSRNALTINIPRTRYSAFKPLVIEFLKYNQEQVNELVLSLYQKGLTARDISDILKEFFSEDISFSQVSSLAERFNEVRATWQNSKLEPHYKIIYADALYMTVKRGNSYAKEAVHVMYGIKDDNTRELLGLNVNPTETAASWACELETLRARGVGAVDLFVADGLQHFEDVVHTIFPGAYLQKCVVHKMRNILNKVRPKHKAEISIDLKHLFSNFKEQDTIEEAYNKLQDFRSKWGKIYPYIANSCKQERFEYYFTYLKFADNYRRMIYTTNSIESLNKKIRKATKNKQSFEKPQRLLDYLFVIIKQHEADNWQKYPLTCLCQWPTKTQS